MVWGAAEGVGVDFVGVFELAGDADGGDVHPVSRAIARARAMTLTRRCVARFMAQT